MTRLHIRKESYVNTVTAQPGQVNAEEEQPIISFTQVIGMTPSAASFAGWGPKVVGTTGLLTRWN